MDFLGLVAGEMFLNLFGLRNPNAFLPDFWIYVGSLLSPLFNEHGFVRVFTERRKAAVYARFAASQAKAAANAQAQIEQAADGGRSSPVAG